MPLRCPRMSRKGQGDEPTQKTTPKGIDPKTGKPYEPVEIPALKRKDFDAMLDRAAKGSA